MAPRNRVAIAIVLAGCVSAPLAVNAQVQPPTPQEAAALADFSVKVEAYAALHRRLEGPVPTPKVSSDPVEISRAVDALGAAIRAARPDAKQGDIFSPEVAALFRRLIRETSGGRFGDLIAMVHEEVVYLGPPQINGKWPGTSYTFMPPNLLCLLPPLPEDLEYRFVRRDLVLWDSHANVIVDFIHNAIPSGT